MYNYIFLVVARGFCDNIIVPEPTVSSTLEVKEEKETKAQRVFSDEPIKGREFIQYLKENAYVEYKEYPNHIGHWNPKSPEYIGSHREEHTLKSHIDGYNAMVDEFKSNVKLQEEVYDMLDTMDRPYLKGTPGIDRNVYDELKDYSNPVGHNNYNPQDVMDNLYEANGKTLLIEYKSL